jgi:hypothetical protein
MISSTIAVICSLKRDLRNEIFHVGGSFIEITYLLRYPDSKPKTISYIDLNLPRNIFEYETDFLLLHCARSQLFL